MSARIRAKHYQKNIYSVCKHEGIIFMERKNQSSRAARMLLQDSSHFVHSDSRNPSSSSLPEAAEGSVSTVPP